MVQTELPAFTLIVGGARSGKSMLAEQLLGSVSEVTYVATLAAGDAEMVERIADHRARRPKNWITVEATAGEDPWWYGVFAHVDRDAAVLVDCLSGAVSNRLLAGVDPSDGAYLAAVDQSIDACRSHAGPVVVVTNEVGSGIVPDNSTARRYRDWLGWANQRFALAAETVLMVEVGIPRVLKGTVPHKL